MNSNALKVETELVATIPHLRAFAMKLCGKPDEAADLVQQAMLRGVAHAPSLPEGSNLNAWMTQVLRNVFIDAWRAKLREEPLQADNDIVAPDFEAETPRWAQVTREQLLHAISQLDPDFRRTYELHARGLGYDQIGAMLGVPRATVGTRLFRARKKLKLLLERELAVQRRAAAASAKFAYSSKP
jgi:RNA polymerase sigma-70 factor (ECF subfamily)